MKIMKICLKVLGLVIGSRNSTSIYIIISVLNTSITNNVNHMQVLQTILCVKLNCFLCNTLFDCLILKN